MPVQVPAMLAGSPMSKVLAEKVVMRDGRVHLALLASLASMSISHALLQTVTVLSGSPASALARPVASML